MSCMSAPPLGGSFTDLTNRRAAGFYARDVLSGRHELQHAHHHKMARRPNFNN
eukprot:SAG11_NODE_1758_length_4306_cov_2.946993_2_plen_53_part_00